MAGYESFYREEPLQITARHLPAELYNLAHRLLSKSGNNCLFVPIRSIQYLAVIDAEEIIFVDREAKHLVELAWRGFRPQDRTGLADPVAYEIHLYIEKGQLILPRLQDEFFAALRQLEKRSLVGNASESSVLPFQKTDK